MQKQFDQPAEDTGGCKTKTQKTWPLKQRDLGLAWLGLSPKCRNDYLFPQFLSLFF